MSKNYLLNINQKSSNNRSLQINQIQNIYYIVQLQVQPDMEELTENVEDIAEEGESKKSEEKLGRLQYRVNIDIYIYNQINMYINNTGF